MKGIKTGGREKNVPNRTTAEMRLVFQNLVENNLETLQADLLAVEPDKRIGFILKMAEFCIPRMQSISIENQLEIEMKQIEHLLQVAPAEAIELITEKIITLKSNYHAENQ
jgi:hypothetical protein